MRRHSLEEVGKINLHLLSNRAAGLTYLKYVIVGEDDGQQRRQIDPQRVDYDVAAIEPVLGKVVRATGSHIALGHITIPAKQRQQRPSAADEPNDQETQHSGGGCQRLARHALDNDAVAIIGNQRHGPDGHAAKERAAHAVNLAEKRTHNPSAIEAV
ncbi:Trissin [Drosophila busckii]|uniref:Trissin n=1 Tax=Drosophila busckii TaxID=30019 RepID=A0A0M5J6T0_DROBS|nr:Trissin [Drosophila busckii]